LKGSWRTKCETRRKRIQELGAANIAAEVYHLGLECFIAGETAISTVTRAVRYRGYPVFELAEAASDEVA
jgi:hypothetical protein